MADDLLGVLTRFHHDVVLPDLERVVDAKLDAKLSPFRREMLANFDAVFQRLDRLDAEYQALRAAVQRLEARVTAIENRLDRMVLRAELEQLKARVDSLQERIAELEAET